LKKNPKGSENPKKSCALCALIIYSCFVFFCFVRALERKQKKKCKEEMVVRVGFMFNIDENQSFVIEKFLGKGTFGRVKVLLKFLVFRRD
jgi:hypothetical protein